MNILDHKYKLLITITFFVFLAFLVMGREENPESATSAAVTATGNSGNSPGNRGATARIASERTSASDAGASLETFLSRQPAALPASLRGTEVDGGVRVDAAGDLILEPAVRDLFEYYLATLGEATLDDVRVWVAHYLNGHLPPEAARQGWALFNDYLDYREKLGEIPDPGLQSDAAALETTLRARQRLRREVLGQEAAQAFFALDEAYDEYMLTRLSVQENDSLSEAQRRQRLEQARAELPEPLREIRQQATAPVRAREQVERMRAEGASEAEVRAWRESQFGAEAADRLEALEARRAEWDRRYRSYRQALSELQLQGLAPADREAAIRRLREKHFQEDEIRRVEALDRIRERQSETRPDA